jgi:hypothetical protein
MPIPPVPPGEQMRNLELEGAHASFVDDRTLFIVLKDGTVYPVEIVVDGKTVSKLTMAAALAQTTIPAIVERVGEEHLFIGSTVGPSVLLKAARVEEVVDSGAGSALTPTAVVDVGDSMDMDDDDGQYFSCTLVCQFRPYFLQISTVTQKYQHMLRPTGCKMEPVLPKRGAPWYISHYATLCPHMVPSPILHSRSPEMG